MYIRICLTGHFVIGERTYKVFSFYFCERKSPEGTVSMSHPPSLFFGVNLWGIAPYSSLSAYFRKVQFNYCIVRVLFLFTGGVFTYIYYHIISQLLIDVFVFAASSGGVLDWTVKS